MYRYTIGLLNHDSKEMDHTLKEVGHAHKEMGHKEIGHAKEMVHNLKVKETKTPDPTHIRAQLDHNTKTTHH